MATVMSARSRPGESFRIHEDVPSTEDTEMNESALHDRHDDEEYDDDDRDQEAPEEADGQESEYSESSEDAITEDANIQRDMEKLQNSFAGFRQKYRLIKRIGEGLTPHDSVAWVEAVA